MKKSLLILFGMIAICTIACNTNVKTEENGYSAEFTNSVEIPDSTNFNQQIDGKQVSLYILKNKSNAKVAITNYGARIVSLIVPNNSGSFTDVVLGYDKLESYMKEGEPFFGAIVGRYANRIANGKFALDGKIYKLELNDGVNTLHGGKNGFFKKVWDARQLNESTLELTYTSVDGEAGYPGNLDIKVTYSLTDANALRINYVANTDKKTVVNLTNHAYFNLNGEGDATILDHQLMINANNITPVNEVLIPAGTLMPVEETPFDFNRPATIGSRINYDHEQLKNGKGYDHNWVLNRKKKGLQVVATVSSPKTGIIMDIITEEPGLQFYSGNFLDGKTTDGKGEKSYPYRSAFCLETQHFPDSPNQITFPKTVLKPGRVYETTTIYKFSKK